MDELWSLWKCLCCSKRNALRSALFVKKYICCARDIYVPTGPRNFTRRKPFFIDGELVWSYITSQYSMEMQDTQFKYSFEHDRTRIDSLRKEATYEFAVCCGCRVEDPEEHFCCDSRPETSKIIPRNDDDDHEYILALEKVLEINRDTPVGMFKIRTWANGDPLEEPRIVDRMREALKSVNFTVPMLECYIAMEGYKPWVDMAEYQHLSINTKEIVEVTEKMLNCGFLNVVAVMPNPEELTKFKGFGLTVGYMSENGFSWERLFEEIEMWKNKTPSSLQCFGLFDKDDRPRPPDLFERLSAYSPTGKMLQPHSRCDIDILPLDDENDAAIMSVLGDGVCFVHGGWEKWKDVLFAISTHNR